MATDNIARTLLTKLNQNFININLTTATWVITGNLEKLELQNIHKAQPFSISSPFVYNLINAAKNIFSSLPSVAINKARTLQKIRDTLFSFTFKYWPWISSPGIYWTMIIIIWQCKIPIMTSFNSIKSFIYTYYTAKKEIVYFCSLLLLHFKQFCTPTSFSLHLSSPLN